MKLPKRSPLQRFINSPISFVQRRLSNLYYEVRAIFLPFNVVKAEKLPRTWCDRDYLMFHVVFQIIVDFVELEQPFKDWNGKEIKRYTNSGEMKAWIELHYGEDTKERHYSSWMNDAERAGMDEYRIDRYKAYSEILYLYTWYKNDMFEFKVRQPEMDDDTAQRLGLLLKKPDLTWDEYFQEEKIHKQFCDEMLMRAIKMRSYLWT